MAESQVTVIAQIKAGLGHDSCIRKELQALALPKGKEQLKKTKAGCLTGL